MSKSLGAAELAAALVGVPQLEKVLIAQAIDWLLATARLSRRLTDADCVAHAARLSAWWPVGSYWPEGVPREWTITNLVRALATVGWEPVESPARELYTEKLCILRGPNRARAHLSGTYVSRETPSHVVWQLDDGRWASQITFLEPLAFTWDELHRAPFTALGPPAVVLARAVTPGRRCE